MDKGFEWIAETQSDLAAVAEGILEFAGDERVFFVKGPMGAGKTSLIKELCKKLGSTDNLSSPTYAIVNEYDSSRGRICHFDLYRINKADELFDLGIVDYLASGDFCFFEWPEILEQAFVLSYCEILISVKGNIRYFHARHTQTE